MIEATEMRLAVGIDAGQVRGEITPSQHREMATTRARLEAGELEAEDVVGHDYKPCLGGWHRQWAWGWIVDECGRSIYVYHYHPCGPVAVYVR